MQHPESGRVLEFETDQPGLQFFTANWGRTDDEPIEGKDGALYLRQGAFCFESQPWPDAVNHVSI
jgi:aldose 1-epimerase